MNKEHTALVARLEAFPMFLLNGAAWIMSTHKEPLCDEAADAIRALAGENQELRDGTGMTKLAAQRNEAFDERDTLRAEVAALKSANDKLEQTVEDLAPRWDANRRDAERYRWLKPLLLLVDFAYKADEDKEEAVLIFELPDGLAVSANLDATIDSALVADKPRFTDGHGNDISHLVEKP